MKYHEISCMAEINRIDRDKAMKLAESMRKNGWIGAPILVCNGELLTGSHRLAALRILADDPNSWEMSVMFVDVALDVTEAVEAKIAEFIEENGYAPEIDYSEIGWLLEGSEAEGWKDEIVEW